MSDKKWHPHNYLVYKENLNFFEDYLVINFYCIALVLVLVFNNVS